jgi:hypothetical protein
VLPVNQALRAHDDQRWQRLTLKTHAHSLFQSITLLLFCPQIKVTDVAAHATMKELAETGMLHMIDLANREAPSKSHVEYKKRVQLCQFWERKLVSSAIDIATFICILCTLRKRKYYDPYATLRTTCIIRKRNSQSICNFTQHRRFSRSI